MIDNFTSSDNNLIDQVQEIVSLNSDVIQLPHTSRKMKPSFLIQIVKLRRTLKGPWSEGGLKIFKSKACACETIDCICH